MKNTIYKAPYCVYLTFPQIFSLRQDCTISNMHNKFPPHSVPAHRGFAHWAAAHKVLGEVSKGLCRQTQSLYKYMNPTMNFTEILQYCIFFLSHEIVVEK